MTIKNNILYGEPVLAIPAHFSFGQYILEKLREHSVDDKKIALVSVNMYMFLNLLENYTNSVPPLSVIS